MKTIKEQIYAQISGALADASFPIDTPEELIAAFLQERPPPARPEISG